MSSNVTSKLKNLDADFVRLTGLEYFAAQLKANKALLTFFFIIGLIGYAGDVVNFSLNIDSENHAWAFGAKAAWASQGRWGMYFLNAVLLPDAIMPVIPMLITIAGTAVGALFFVKTLSSTRGVADYLAGAIAIVCPTLYFAFYFTTLGYGVGIAFAITCFGMYMLTQWTRVGFVIAALCFCFGISIYQAVLPLICVLFALYTVSVIIHQQQIELGLLIRRGLLFVLSVILGYIVYEVIKRWSLYYLNVGFDAGYIGGFVNFTPSWGYLVEAFDKTWPLAVNYYTGGADYYLYDLKSLQILFYLTFAISIAQILCAKNTWLIRALAVILLLLALAAPIAMHLMNRGYMPPRTVLGVPQVLAALVFFSLLTPSKILKSIVIALAVACLYKFCVVNNRYAFSNAMMWQADRELSVQIQQRIAEVLPKIANKSDRMAVYPLELVGWVEHAQTPVFVEREVVGVSFYKWGAGDVERIERLFKTMGVDRFRSATPAERVSIVEQAQNMPDWPYPGSVDVINGVIVVKFREYNNPNQFRAMCRPPADKHPVCLKYLPR